MPSKEEVKLFALGFFATIGFFVVGCAVHQRWYRGPDEPRPKVAHIKPGVSIKMEGLDRMEIFVAGVHAGTFVFDGSGAVYVGDAASAARVIQELLTQIEMLRAYRNESEGDRYQ